ncbi:MAG: CoA transferase [Pseudomonadota bacterium]
MSALNGIRVVELSSERSMYAGKLMADMGADVILIEPPGGDIARTYPPFVDDKPDPERSLYFWHYNTSKRGIVLDLDNAEDREQFLSLVRSADVLLEAEPRTRLADLGIDWPQLSEGHERLIHVAMTTFGRNETRSDDPATDLTLLAGGGPAWSCGYDDHSLPPVRGGGNQGYHTACHFAVMSVLTALLYRGQSQRGQFIDLSMHRAQNVTTEASSYGWLVAQGIVQRQTGRHATVQPTGPTQLQCADGRWANTGVPPRFPAEFARLSKWLGELGLLDDFPEAIFLEMGANWEGPFDLSKIGIDEELTAIFMAGREGLTRVAQNISAQEFFVGCQRAGLSVGAINSPEEAFENEHFVARGYQVEVEHPEIDRSIRYPGAPYKLPASPWRISRRAPQLGEHQAEVLVAPD